MDPHPFKVKAVHNYSSEHDDDLSFMEGQIITVTDQEDDDWYYGEYDNKYGLFPRNFVERYEPVTPPRPSRPHHRQPTEPVLAPSAPAAALPAEEAPTAARATEATQPEQERKNEEEPSISPPPLIEATKPMVQATAPPPVQPSVQAKSPEIPTKAVPPSDAPQAKAAPAADKPIGSFRDRIAAFNKPGAGPVAPPKPGGFGSASGFIKKPYVPPPPSRNAYVPPAIQAPVAKVYRREEEPEFRAEAKDDEAAREIPAKADEPPEEDQPKPMSLKERMAMLQKQQLEQQTRHADAVTKKPKPKPPPKKPTEPRLSGDSAGPGAIETQDAEVPLAERPEPPQRILSNDSRLAASVHSIETVDTEEHPGDEPSEGPERAGPTTVSAERGEVLKADNDHQEEEDEEDEEDEEMDPEVRRRMEIRERMAKMSGGMGMGAMFGAPTLPGMGARKPPKSKSAQSSTVEEPNTAASPPAQPIPVMPGVAMPGMAIPGMARPQQKAQDDFEEEVGKEDESSAPPITNARDPDEMPDIEEVQGDDQDEQSRQVEPERTVASRRQTRPVPEAPGSPVGAPLSPTASRPIPIPQSVSHMSPPERPVSGRPPPSDDELDNMCIEDDEFEREAADGSTYSRAVPPVPRQAPEPARERVVPPPPAQVSSPTLAPSSPPSSPPTRSEKRISRLPPPIPGAMSSNGPPSYGRAPPPPPPSQPPRPSLELSRDEQSEDSVDESDEDEGETIATQDPSAGRSSQELHHDGLPSLGPAVRAPPPVPSQAPRAVPPPPPPGQASRQSREMPRVAPPLPPTAAPPMRSPHVKDDYDPYNYESNPMSTPTTDPPSIPWMDTRRSQPDDQGLYGTSSPQNPQSRRAPPLPTGPPPQVAPAPAAAPPLQAPIAPTAPPSQPAPQAPQLMSPPMPPVESRKSLDVLSQPQGRRSIDVSRQSISMERHDYIASDLDLGYTSGWWTSRKRPPPSLQSRADVSIDYDESSTMQGDGRALITKHVYVLYTDYSQSIITARFPDTEPGNVDLQQRHEPPPARLRQDQLEAFHAHFGARVAAAAKSHENHAVGDGSAFAFVNEIFRSIPGALPPVGNRSYGSLVYANLANATVQQFDEIRAGDIVSFRKAKLQGHRGGLKQKYSVDLGADHVGVVMDWDGTKKKVRAWDQSGKKVKVESYKLGDLRSGEVKVWRTMSRDWVGWGTSE